MTEITIRPESREDLRGIDIVNIAAFEEEDEAALVNAIRRTPFYVPELSLVAERHNRIIGHMMMFRATVEQPEKTWAIVGLAPMSVLPSHSHRGIGSRLVTEGLERAERQGFPAVVVAGYPGFYSRFGFQPAHLLGLECNLPVSRDAVLVKTLREGVLRPGGTLCYPPLFQQFYQSSSPPVDVD